MQQDLRLLSLRWRLRCRFGLFCANSSRIDFVQMNKEYVQAAVMQGQHPFRIMFVHILPNILGRCCGYH
jgi:peptide/nickel transport system permease protein